MGDITAPMAGKVIEVKVSPGDSISEGDEVVIMEAMKMEIPVVAFEGGTISEVKCGVGDAVETGAVIVSI